MGYHLIPERRLRSQSARRIALMSLQSLTLFYRTNEDVHKCDVAIYDLHFSHQLLRLLRHLYILARKELIAKISGD